MRKINFLWLMGILMLLPISFVSCSDDDENNGSSSLQLLYGTWEEIKQESYRDGEIIPDHWSKWTSWTFKKDGSVIHFSPTYVDEGSYEFNGNYIKLYYDWYGYDQTKNCEILQLDAETLIWKTIYGDDEYDYQILYLSRTTSEYDDPAE